KDIRDLPRRHVREVAVALIGNDAFQSDMAILHDDVDRWRRPCGIPEQWGIEAVNPAIQDDPELVIHRRKRQHLKLVDDTGRVFESLDTGFRIVFQRGTHNLSTQSNGAIRFHFRLKPIKYTVI